MAKLATVVFLRDPERHRTVILHPGEEPAPHLAALITAPEAWEDGQLPDLPDPDPEDNDPGEREKADGKAPEPEPSEPETEKEAETEGTSPEEEAPAKPARKTTARKPAAQ